MRLLADRLVGYWLKGGDSLAPPPPTSTTAENKTDPNTWKLVVRLSSVQLSTRRVLKLICWLLHESVAAQWKDAEVVLSENETATAAAALWRHGEDEWWRQRWRWWRHSQSPSVAARQCFMRCTTSTSQRSVLH